MEILEVVKVERINFVGTVYNFEVEDDNSYTANGIIVKNCRGKDVPVKVEDGKIKYRQGLKGRRRRDDSFERWFSNLSKSDKQQVLGKAKYELWQAGEFNLKELVKGNRVLSLEELSNKKAIKELKESLTDVDKARKLVSELKEKLPKKSLKSITDTSEITEYEKFLNSKDEIYKVIPNEILRENGTDRRTLIAEVKRERKLLTAKKKELKLKKAIKEYEQAKSNIET